MSLDPWKIEVETYHDGTAWAWLLFPHRTMFGNRLTYEAHLPPRTSGNSKDEAVQKMLGHIPAKQAYFVADR